VFDELSERVRIGTSVNPNEIATVLQQKTGHRIEPDNPNLPARKIH
jgi:hypothetical protein